MNITSKYFLFFFFFSYVLACDKTEQINSFARKLLNNNFPDYNNNPYENLTESESLEINKTIHDKNIVCAIQYTDSSKLHYNINQFSSNISALESNYIITHQGKCGSCSTLQDLSVYLKDNLTSPARICGVYGFFSKSWSINCFNKLGFTSQCSEIWYYNTVNTRKNCGFICMKSWIMNEPNVDEEGNLNKCLNCDEVISGPVFKYYSGRTRRNSGIKSEIDRPSDQIYNMTQCYY